MKRIRRNYSLQFIIAISSIFIAVISMAYIGSNIYKKFSEQLMKNATTFSEQILEQISINVEEYISEGIKIHEEIAEISREEKSINENFLTKLNLLFSNKISVVSISAFDEDGDLLFIVPKYESRDDYDISYVPDYEALIEDTSFITTSRPRVQKVYKDKYDWVLSYGKRLKMSDEDRAIIINVDMRFEPITRILSDVNLGGSGFVYIKNRDGDCIYAPYHPYISKTSEIAYGENWKAIERDISFVNWQLVGITHLDNFVRGNYEILIDILSTIPLVLLVIILITWFISWQISKPINILNRTMEKVSEGDFSVRANMKSGEKEVVALSANFDNMVETVEDLVKQNEIKEKNKRKSELNALQAQINPHFLYNTLDSIMWMAENGSKEEVISMVGALAKLFRISISKGRRMITVEKELEHVKNYLLIQKIRYKNRFDFEIEIAEGVAKLYTLKLIVQPMVENALYHGIENLMEKGELKIRAYIRQDSLIFEIEDNGVGMTEEKLRQLNEIEGEVESKKGSGVGIKNIRDRLNLSYGSGCGVLVKSEEDEGTNVSIYQPIMEDYCEE